MTLDISDTLAAKSDQLNADDLIGGPITVTVERVTRSSDEQPVVVHLSDGYRPYKPCKSMRRILAAVWGADAGAWVGRRLTLYRDSSVRFGGMDVGGLRISHMSHIDRPVTTAIMVTRGKKAPWTVEPLRMRPTPAGLLALNDAIAELGIDADRLNAWHIASDRGPIADLDDTGAGRLAEYLRSPNGAKRAESLRMSNAGQPGG